MMALIQSSYANCFHKASALLLHASSLTPGLSRLVTATMNKRFRPCGSDLPIASVTCIMRMNQKSKKMSLLDRSSAQQLPAIKEQDVVQSKQYIAVKCSAIPPDS